MKDEKTKTSTKFVWINTIMQRIYGIPPPSPRDRIQAQNERKSSGGSQKKVEVLSPLQSGYQSLMTNNSSSPFSERFSAESLWYQIGHEHA